jgi:hypothetical protein
MSATAAARAACRDGRDASAWTSADLARDTGWIRSLDAADRADLLAGLRAGRRPGKPLLEYRREDFPFGERAIGRLREAVDDAQHGRGVALVRGLPREGLEPADFELLTWAIGLHLGVARPQDRMSNYINPVKDVGAVYRSPTGRGYSSRSELDFHVDGGDVVLLSCYNQAPVGGDSLCSSGVTAWRQLVAERPDLAEALEHPVPHSRQGEQPEGIAPWFPMPVFARTRDDVFCTWNRNRITNGFKFPDAPACTDVQVEAMALLDEILRRPEVMYSMRLEPGDVQILSDFTTLHSRTAFEDHADETRKRTLYRLWLSTPNGLTLPSSLSPFWGAVEPGVVRGGTPGQHHDDARRAFVARQAEALGMRVAPGTN